jgi:acetoin utilization protein AcuB
MTAFEHIDPSIPFLKTTDSIEKGLGWMEDYKISNMAVVNPETNEYLGLISETVLLNEAGSSLLISDMQYHSQESTVKLEDHIYEALSIINTTGLDVVPVIDTGNKFSGVLTSKVLLQCLSQITSISTHGGIVELMMNTYDYSMVEIARAVESNGAKILSSYISNVDGGIDKIKVLLKLNISDLSLVIAEFHQLNYTVVALYSDYVAPDNTEENYRHFFKYLDL